MSVDSKKIVAKYVNLLKRKMAELTGLEPAAFRVTGGRYNQLNYNSVKYLIRSGVNLWKTRVKVNCFFSAA